jgi:ubiquinol-cytochrome c reductase cytochrome b subunit
MQKTDFQKTFAGITDPLKAFFDEPMPKGVGWANTLGSALLATIAIQIITGILLALYYSPNAEVAYESVQYIEEHVLFGSIIRGVHHFAASAFVIIIFLHILRTFFWGAYKQPREMTWILGVALFLVVLGFAFTGYLLPWDMKAYFATKVGINVGGVIPVIGGYIIKIMQGGAEMSTLTLTRFYALHVIVLPLALILIVFGHVYFVRLHGPAPPGKKEGEKITYSHRFYPLQLFKDSAVTLVLVAVLIFLAATFGAPLEEKADPTSTDYIPRPDWYFYALFQLLKIFEGRLEIIGAVVIPGIFFTIMLLLPFLDRNPERKLARRPVAASFGTACVVGIIALTAWGGYAGNKAKALLAANKAALAAEEDSEKEVKFDLANGEKLFVGLECASCHDMPAQGDNIPPGLAFSGNKYRHEWLASYLQKPHRVRWLKRNERPIAKMPNFDLTKTEADDITAFMLTMRVDAKFPEPEFDWAEADSDMVISGQGLFADYGCDGCHTINGKGDEIGPDLSYVASKLQENYMYQLIKKPRFIIPDTPMKDAKLEQEEVEDIVAYLRTLK